jgi:DNA-binding MarR family transcriptional regulator
VKRTPQNRILELESERRGDRRAAELSATRPWTFITHHALVLLAVAQNPDLRVTEIAEATGITERYAYRVLNDLESGGYVTRGRQGRRNLYRVSSDLAADDGAVEEYSLRELLRLVVHRDSDELLGALAPRRRPG